MPAPASRPTSGCPCQPSDRLGEPTVRQAPLE